MVEENPQKQQFVAPGDDSFESTGPQSPSPRQSRTTAWL